MTRCVTVLLLASILAAPAAAETPSSMTADDDPAINVGWLVVKRHPWMVARGILPDPSEGGANTGGAK